MADMTAIESASADVIRSRILTVRGVQVMLDRDLAALYGVPTKALNQAVKRNIERFPEEFMFAVECPWGLTPWTLPFKDLEIKEFCKCLDEFVSKAEEWRETVENFRPAAEEAAVRDEEDAQFRRFGMNGPGFMSV